MTIKWKCDEDQFLDILKHLIYHDNEYEDEISDFESFLQYMSDRTIEEGFSFAMAGIAMGYDHGLCPAYRTISDRTLIYDDGFLIAYDMDGSENLRGYISEILGVEAKECVRWFHVFIPVVRYYEGGNIACFGPSPENVNVLIGENISLIFLESENDE